MEINEKEQFLALALKRLGVEGNVIIPLMIAIHHNPDRMESVKDYLLEAEREKIDSDKIVRRVMKLNMQKD